MSGQPGEQSLDPWSVVHVLAGLLLGLFVRNVWLALALLGAYELLEGGLRRVKRPGQQGKGLFEHESWGNIVFDLLFGMIGWLFAQGAPRISLPW